MDKEFKLPDPGEGIHEAEVVEIPVSEGDSVEEGQSVIVVETDKAANEVPSPFSGVIKEIRVDEGQLIDVGEVLMIFTVDDETGEEEKKNRAEKEPAEEQPTKEPSKAEESAGKGKKKEREEEEKRTKGQIPVPASPATRRLARELEVDLAAVSGSGPHGRVTDEDIRKAAEGKPQEEETVAEKAAADRKTPEKGGIDKLPDFSKWGPVDREPLRSVRRTIARRMADSWRRIPHVTHEDEVDITDLEDFRTSRKEAIKAHGAPLTLTPFIIKAAVAALKEHPRFNASLDTESEEILYKRYYHIGVAVDTENGLLVPVLRDVDRKSLTELTLELFERAERARNGKAGREELSGATFTITNVGSLGGTGFTPIINYPQAAILGIARSVWKPVVQGIPPKHKVVPRLMLPLALGFDHRLVDGAEAARFMNKVITYLHRTDSLMMNI